MDVSTEGTASDFRYTILGEGGSEYIRSHVFKTALETERQMWRSDAPDHAAITPKNYTFEDRGGQPVGLARIGVKPKRKDLLLVDGSIFLRPDDGDLVTVEGTLSKNPSFWVRHVKVVGHYERIAGVRLPVAFESVANIVIAGESTFTMTYDYEMVNGQQRTAGSPVPPDVRQAVSAAVRTSGMACVSASSCPAAAAASPERHSLCALVIPDRRPRAPFRLRPSESVRIQPGPVPPTYSMTRSICQRAFPSIRGYFRRAD